MEDDYFLRRAQIRMVVALDLANCFASLALSWTWLTAKSKCLGSDMFARPILPHSLENVQIKDGHSLGHALGMMIILLGVPKRG